MKRICVIVRDSDGDVFTRCVVCLEGIDEADDCPSSSSGSSGGSGGSDSSGSDSSSSSSGSSGSGGGGGGGSSSSSDSSGAGGVPPMTQPPMFITTDATLLLRGDNTRNDTSNLNNAQVLTRTLGT